MVVKKYSPANNDIEPEEAYFEWLCERIKSRWFFDNWIDVESVLRDMYNYEFYCLIPNDDNRVEDGLALRDEFGVRNLLATPCSFLEMLIALSEKMAFQLFDLDKGNETPKWFWKLYANLHFIPHNTIVNEKIMRRVVERKYPADNYRGLFPLKNPKKNQREVEIWYQMQAYISEMLIN